jgi:hypothetical protein
MVSRDGGRDKAMEFSRLGLSRHLESFLNTIFELYTMICQLLFINKHISLCYERVCTLW